MKRLMLSLVAAFAIAAPPAFAGDGVIALEDSARCDYAIVETTMGYTLIEWFGGTPHYFVGDRVYGDLNSFGMKSIYVDGRGEVIPPLINRVQK